MVVVQLAFISILLYLAVANPIFNGKRNKMWISYDRYQEPYLWESSGKFQGDMVLTLQQKLRINNGNGSRNGVIDIALLWPNKTIPYQFSSSFSADEREFIASVLEEDYGRTCLRVVPRTTEPDYVYITAKDDGCWSYVGRMGGKQKLNLQPDGCLDYSTIVHEFMHAVGFEHQQSATDRDDYVIIKWENIEEDEEENFIKYDKDEVSSFKEPYDYHSVMHYDEYAFSRNGEKTIIPRKNVEIGMAHRLSDIDINKINKMYKCFNKPRL